MRKRIHPPDRPVLPSDCWTKAAYAKHIGKSQTWVDKLIERGDLTVIEINGNVLVKSPKPAPADK